MLTAITATVVLTATLGAPEIAPDARPTLDRMFNYYKSLPGASVTMDMKIPLPGAPEQKVEYSAIKPNKFTMTTDLTMMEAGTISVRSDGTNAWVVSSKLGGYSEEPAPKQFADMKDLLTGGLSGPVDLFFSLLAPDPEKALLGDMKMVSSGGTKDIGDVTYDVISMTPDTTKVPMLPPGLTIDLAVNRGTTPWLHNATLSFVDPEGQMPPMTITLEMKDWKVVKAGGESFAFKPSPEDKKVDDVFEELFAGGPGDEEDAKFDAMKGQPAPDFSLKDLDGNTVTLASLRGKTVILDFFATWCGPCKMGMPVLMDIAAARAGDGVVLYVVDVDEPAEKIRKFLEKNKWDINVLLMGESKIGTDYKVGGIPHTVVIAPDGTIQFIEVGFRGKEHAEQAINGAIDEALGKAVASAG